MLQETKAIMTTRSVQVPINIWLRSNSFYAEIDDVTVEFVHENVIKLPKIASSVHRFTPMLFISAKFTISESKYFTVVIN